MKQHLNGSKSALLLFFIAAVLFLTACGPSKEVKNVINSINSLPEITLDSKTLLDEIDNAYNALDDEEKQQIDNYSVFEDAKKQYSVLKEENDRKEKNQMLLEELDNSIKALDQLTVSNPTELEDFIQNIKEQYGALDDDYKAQATSYNHLDSHIVKSVVKSVRALSRQLQPISASAVLNKYKDLLNDSQKMSCLGDIGLYSCIKDATETIKRINSGKVFDFTSNTISCTKAYQEGENNVEGELNISGMNYFGGPYTTSISVYYTFNINLEKCTVTGVTGITL